jgi:uncharacterized protein (DUF1800 family)
MLIQLRFVFFLWCWIAWPAAAGMGLEEARHLSGRAGFGASQATLQSFAGLSREQAVQRLMADDGNITRPPAWAEAAFENPARLREMSDEDKRRYLQERQREGIELRAWWLSEMRQTPAPLLEKMTLFWHNHFATGMQKVKSGQLLYRQNLMLRRHALGNFGALLHAVAKDPAMLVYLDTVQSRRDAPNENFAREVMELFTLGEGHYSEQDIKQAARAFTGWGLDRDNGTFQNHPFRHDSGEKTVFGRSGRFNGDDVIDLLLARPETAEFIVGKLWTEFVSPEKDAREIQRLARVFRDGHYEIRPLLTALFTSDAFFAAKNRGALIKSPVELVLGTLIALEMPADDLRPFAFVTRDLGQDLFNPPNVKGWPGGEAWINSDSLLKRKQFLARLGRGSEMPAEAMRLQRGQKNGQMNRQGAKLAEMALTRASQRADLAGWVQSLPGLDRRETARKLLLALPPVEMNAKRYDDDADYVASLLQDPVYQLK